jgi:hypothetical protein
MSICLLKLHSTALHTTATAPQRNQDIDITHNMRGHRGKQQKVRKWKIIKNTTKENNKQE